MKSKLPEYKTFKDLTAAHQRGRDYDFKTCEQGLDLVFVAPHGGRIEPETEVIARQLAGDDFSFHVFESHLSPRDYNLHITSHRYNERSAIDLVRRCRKAVGVHGRRSKVSTDEEIWMGGLNRQKVLAVSGQLNAAGFKTRIGGHPFPATHRKNICNRAIERGVQLEMTLALRKSLCGEAARMSRFIAAVRRGMGYPTVVDSLGSGAFKKQ